MMDALVHRGPDAAGTFMACDGAGGLGHRRLRIVDPDGGDQPLLAGDGSRALAANGEVYNAPALRRRLEHRHRFTTRSDSEVVLHLYAEEGTNAVHHLDGMYALAIADGDELFLARDPVGVKPLYTGQCKGDLVFASEIKALPPGTTGVCEFPPGAAYSSVDGFSTFYTVPDPEPVDEAPSVHAGRIRRSLDDAVVKRLMSDVPLGAFLSGGLDSSAITALIRPHVDALHTFTVGVEGSPDLEAARLMARLLGTIHHEHLLSAEEVAAHLPRIVYLLESFDQDLVRSAVPTYFTARLAAEHVKVVLTGEGADELFAGYRYHCDVDGDEGLRRELRRSVTAMHNTNLQRVDRMTMAHSLEARVPFLDPAMIELALGVPVPLKRARRGQLEKWILRTAVEDLLPTELAWRDKAQFDEGTGSVALLASVTEEMGGETDVRAYRQRYPQAELRSAEECLYHRLLCEAFADPEPVLATVARWSRHRLAS
ncbi:MAG: asparagine synthase B [Actinomycetota bacterium]|nr:asparagine synthase B [Actinomycetota bacterium]